MTLPITPPNFETPPKEYDPRYMIELVRTLEAAFKLLNTQGPIRASIAHISSLPTSNTGLRSGDLWNDLGTVKVIP